MHCLRVIHVENEYGPTRLAIFNGLMFLLVYSFAYVTMSFNYPSWHEDHYFWMNLLIVPIIYPVHKLLHYIVLLGYKQTVSIKLLYGFFPIIRLRLNDLVPRNRYLLALLAPFLVINSVIIILSIDYPQFAHYFSFYLAYHCSICVIDLLYVKILVSAPNNAIIEETPKGYEILLPSRH